MCPQHKNLSPKQTLKQQLYQRRVSVRTNAPTPQNITPALPPEKPIREVSELLSTRMPENKISRLDVVMVCVNYSDLLVVSLSDNIKIIEPKHIFVVTDGKDLLTQQICHDFGVNCIITERFYENDAIFNKGKGLNEGIQAITDPDWILITDADIIFPPDLLSILNDKSVNRNKLYAATRYLCGDYTTYQKYKTKKITLEQMDGVHRCPPVGYFQLFHIKHPNLIDNTQPIYPEISGDASWSDMLFADKFPQKECIQSIKLIHLGDHSQNWKGRKTKRFINDETFDMLIKTENAYPFIPSIRKQKRNHKLAVITSLFNPAGYANIKMNYNKFKKFISDSGVDLFTAELVFEGQEFHTKKTKFNLHIRGNSNNIMWQKERLLNLILDKVPSEYTNIAWIDCDVILDNPNWVDETNTKLQQFKMLQLFDSGHFYDENKKIGRISDGIIKHLHAQKHEQTVNFHPLYGGTPGLAWAIRRECIDKMKFIDNQIIGGGDGVMMLAAIGRFDDQFIYQNMNDKLLSHTLVWSNAFYREIQNSLFYVSGKAYHLYHGTNLKRNYNHRMKYLTENDYNPRHDITLDDNQLWAWNSDKPDLHKKLQDYFFERDEDDNLKQLNYYFDGIFCINLDRRTDKWDVMSNRFKKYNINVERIRAFDGKWDAVNNEWEIARQKLNHKFGSKMSNPSAYGLLENQFAYGTLCTHISVIQLAKQRNLKRILIFEDDVVFHNDFNNQLKQILKFNNWKLLYLGASQHRWENITIQDGYYYANRTLGGFAYAIDASVYDEILSLAWQHEKSFDNCLGNFDGNDIQSKYPNDCYVIYPNIAIADVRESDLREKRDPNEHAIKMKWDLNSYDFS